MGIDGTAATLGATALALSGCLYFELTDANGDMLKSDHDVRRACAGALRIA
jgi:hypothetical protein